eukprot:SAG31_NODE_4494_length_3187_cov_13.919365_4_plen_86_part_00
MPFGLNVGEADEFIPADVPDVSGVDTSGELEETRLTGESSSVLWWILRDSWAVESPSSSDEAVHDPEDEDEGQMGRMGQMGKTTV